MGHLVHPLHRVRTGSIIHKLASGLALNTSPVMAIPQFLPQQVLPLP